MGILSRLGLARASDLEALRGEVASLETRNRMLRATSSGVPITWGAFDYEDNDQMKGEERWSTIDKMEADPHVKGALLSVLLPLVTAEWEVKAASDSARDVEIAEFVSSNLLRTEGERYGKEYWCQSSWRAQRLAEILDMLRAGYSAFNLSTREVEGKWVFDRIQWLEPASVDPHGWQITDDDQIVQINRTYLKPSSAGVWNEPIPAKQLALYVWDLRGARFEGRPFVRSMFGPWYRKDFLQRQAMMWAQKIGAPVPYGVYPDNWPPGMKSAFKTFVESLRGTSPREAYGVFERKAGDEGPSVAFAGADAGEVDRMRGLIDGENSEISHAAQNKSSMLGETQTGARALAEPMGKREMLFLNATAVTVCEWENHGVGNLPGIVQRLVDWNFAGVKNYPQLVCSKIDPYEGLSSIDQLVKAKQAGLVPDHPALRRAVTERFGIALPDDAYEIEPEVETPPLPGKAGGEPTGGEPEGVEGDEEESAAASLEAFRDRVSRLLAPSEEKPPTGGGFRKPTVLEAQCVNLAAVAETFRVGERGAMTAIREIRYRMTEEILGRVAAGKFTMRNLDGQRRSRFRGYSKAVRLLVAPLEVAASDGRAHVRSELAKQR